LKKSVRESFAVLCSEVAARDHALILSYPTNGLLSEEDATATLREYFSDVQLALRKTTRHSTLGGRHGSQHNLVEELVWLARTKRSPSKLLVHHP
jgi:hypothetical protein